MKVKKRFPPAFSKGDKKSVSLSWRDARKSVSVEGQRKKGMATDAVVKKGRGRDSHVLREKKGRLLRGGGEARHLKV